MSVRYQHTVSRTNCQLVQKKCIGKLVAEGFACFPFKHFCFGDSANSNGQRVQMGGKWQNTIGARLYQQGQYSAALQQFQKVIATDPDNATATTI